MVRDDLHEKVTSESGPEGRKGAVQVTKRRKPFSDKKQQPVRGSWGRTELNEVKELEGGESWLQ